MDKSNRYQCSLLAGFFSLLSTALVLSLILWLISKVYHPPKIDISFIKKTFVLNPSDFRPEPVERMQFVLGIVVLPFLLGVSYKVFEQFLAHRFHRSRFYGHTSLLYPGMISGGMVFFILHNSSPYTSISYDLTPFSLVFLILGSVFCSHLLCVKEPVQLEDWGRRLLAWSGELFAFLAGCLVCLYCIMDLRTITDSPIYIYSFNAVFHSVVQVFMGKQLLVDLNHQYGLYPYLIEPIFRVTGLSVLSFSVLMSLLMGGALASIYIFLRSAIKERVIASLAFCVLIYYCYFFGRIINYQEYYYQYHPVRFFFPALSILLCYRFITKPTLWLYYLSFFLYSIALLWNFDSGFVVFFSWLLLLFYTESTDMNIRNMVKHVLSGSIIVCIVFILFMLSMYVRYGRFPDFTWALEYQKLFYIHGYYMLPMPLWHPWMIVICIYAASLLYSIVKLLDKRVTSNASMFFYLSILGIGLFSYYQGRSHDYSLPAVVYPVFMIWALYMDMLVEQVKKYDFSADKISLVLLLFAFIYINVTFVSNVPEIALTIKRRVTPLFTARQTSVSKNFDYVRNHTQPEEELLILTQLSGVYSLAAQSPCPLRIPGTTELSLKEDFDNISKYLDTRATKVVADAFFVPFVMKSTNKMKISSMSPDKTLFIFTRQTQ
jgi:hypothetical protein